jgi:hypothetical protein
MHVGASGRRTSEGVVADFGRRGYLVTGPDEELPMGEYEVEFAFRPYPLLTWAGPLRRVVVEVVAGSECLVQKRINPMATTQTLEFSISAACYERRGVVEFRILRGRFIGFVLTSVTVRRRSAPAIRAPEAVDVLERLGLPHEGVSGSAGARRPPGVIATERV